MDELDVFERCGLNLTDMQKAELEDLATYFYIVSGGAVGLDELLIAIMRLSKQEIDKMKVAVYG